MTYTKEQLIEAMKKYNADAIDNPENYSEIDKSEDSAIQQIEHLLSYIQ